MSLTSSLPASCQHLSTEVGILLKLLKQQSSLRGQDVPAVQASLRKVVSPTFEIVFAGAFSAGKMILQQYSQARSHLETTLEKEAQEQLATTQRQQVELQAQVIAYNKAVRSINSCFQEMRIDRYQLPLVDAVNLGDIVSE